MELMRVGGMHRALGIMCMQPLGGTQPVAARAIRQKSVIGRQGSGTRRKVSIGGARIASRLWPALDGAVGRRVGHQMWHSVGILALRSGPLPGMDGSIDICPVCRTRPGIVYGRDTVVGPSTSSSRVDDVVAPPAPPPDVVVL